MNISDFNKFAESVNLKYSQETNLSDYTTFRVGGLAEVFIEPENLMQISSVVKYCNENKIDIHTIGKGSNLLISDDGVDGVIMHMGNNFSDLHLIDDETVYCSAGVNLIRLCKFALENSLSGLEFAYGIPGSVGGAVFMNAGAYGGEIKDVILFADHIDKKGNEGRFCGEKLEMSYRHSVYSGGDYFITGAAFRLKKSNSSEIKAKMDELLNKRYEKQPMDKPSAGSTFKRPEGAFASALIDECGLKGYKVGGAEVSTKHAGFIINNGGATADDILKLIDEVKDIVKSKTGFLLEPEVEIW